MVFLTVRRGGKGQADPDNRVDHGMDDALESVATTLELSACV